MLRLRAVLEPFVNGFFQGRRIVYARRINMWLMHGTIHRDACMLPSAVASPAAITPTLT